MVLCFYQDIVALIVPNTIRIGAMDHQCFLSSTKAHVNYMNFALQDKPCEEAALKNFEKLFEKMPKLTYKVKEICGDYYYEKMTYEETMAKAFIRPASAEK